MAVNAKLLELWKTFGDTRFTKSDLWREFGGQAFPGFPTPEFIASFRFDDADWIEAAPGPRGGAGWKLTATTVVHMKKLDAKKAAQQASIDDLISGVTVEFGSLRLVPSYRKNHKDKLVWRFMPPVEIEGRNVDGSRRYPNDAFTLTLAINSKPDFVQCEMNSAIRHVRELAVAQKAELSKKIEILCDLVTPAKA